MLMRAAQQGVGMIEILVALLVLAIGVLGFSFLQMRAIDASHEAMSKLQAMNLARDLSEKIRANSNAYTQYQARINAETQTTTAKSCVQKGTTNPCVQAADFAHYDAAQIIKNANGLGMSIKMPNCQVSNNLQSRRCIYVAWGKTKPIDDASAKDACTHGGSYLPKAQCIVMELY